MDKKHSLSNCSQCGQLFIRTKDNYCNKCSGSYKNTRHLIKSYMEKKSNININEISNISKLKPELVSKLIKENIYWGTSTTTINCRVCGKPILASSRRLVCYDCLNEFENNSSAHKKVLRIRQELREKDRRLREYKKTKSIGAKKVNTFSFKNPFKEHLEKYMGTKEAEFLPDINPCCSLKLSCQPGYATVMA